MTQIINIDVKDEKSQLLSWDLYEKLQKTRGYIIVKFSDGDEMYLLDGNYHREDGPASIFDGENNWYLNGELYNIYEWNKITKFYTDEELVLEKLKE